MEDWENGGFGLYVHWPYCVSKCPYCDFNSHVSQSIDEDVWAKAYISAINQYAAETSGRQLNSIYFGGGTPSLMQSELVAAVIEQAQKCWHFANDIEITLEANPNSVEAARFQGYKQAGVNRISLGVQALNDDDLRRLGRMHSTTEALTALDIARSLFDRVSFDLIYARQDQTLSDWEAELTQALSFDPSHLSLYQLTIEPGTVFGARHNAGKLSGLPNENLSADMYELTNNICNNKGLPAYEVSNHAKNGFQSNHNLIYWNAGDYIGIGPGAHGRLTISGERFATETPLSPQDWLEKTVTNQTGEAARIRLSGEDQAIEYLIMGLRTSTGISLPRYESMGGQALEAAEIAHLIALGMIKHEGDRLAATAQGMPVLNGIIRALAP